MYIDSFESIAEVLEDILLDIRYLKEDVKQLQDSHEQHCRCKEKAREQLKKLNKELATKQLKQYLISTSYYTGDEDNYEVGSEEVTCNEEQGRTIIEKFIKRYGNERILNNYKNKLQDLSHVDLTIPIGEDTICIKSDEI